MFHRLSHSTVLLGRSGFLGILYFILLLRPATADVVVFRGKVVMEDGSPPGHPVSIQRNCQGMDHALMEGTASGKTGEYFVKLDVTDFGTVFSGGLQGAGIIPCVLEAVTPGYVSTKLDLSDWHVTMNWRFPNIVLTRATPGLVLNLAANPSVPRAASRPWSLAIKLIEAHDWAAAISPLRAVVEAAPKFAPAWVALGSACERQQNPAEARTAFEHAIALDPKPLAPYLELASAETQLRDFEAASKTSETVIRTDSKHTFLEAYLLNAVAHYQLRDYDGALARLNDLARLDKNQDFPRAEYIQGLVYEARKDLPAAATHMRTYLDQHPHAKDFQEVSQRLANLGKQPVAELADEVTATDLRPPQVGEAPVPGGMKAFAAIANLRETPTYQDFFLQYCRAIAANEFGTENRTLESKEAIKAFISAVGELEQLGERGSNRTILRLAVDTDDHRHTTERILNLLGWKLVSSGDAFSAEPGDQPIDGLRQRFPAAFGIDELDMRTAIEARRPFQFEIPIETARLVGGTAWSVLLKGVPEFSGSTAEVFIHDTRYARVYAGLGAMDADAAGAVVSSVGLVNLIVKYSSFLAEFGSALTISQNHVAVPGGVKSQAAWAGLVGASPDNPALFFRALFDKDQGRILSFYFDLARADAAHQQFFAGPASRIEAFYKWYRDSVAQTYLFRPQDRWQSVILQELSLDSSGKIVFPGSRQTWGAASGTDAEILLHLPSAQALAAAAQLEHRRGAALDAESVAILVRHRDEWRNLAPYLEKLPGLGASEFQALASFTEEAGKLSGDRQATRLGDWHSLVELIVLASQAGSLDTTQAAQAFRHACELFRSDDPSAHSITVLRAMAGGTDDLDEAVATRLLRLSGARRAAFERVKELQQVPSLRSLDNAPDAHKTLAALSGLVYAAVLDPQYLLVAEDHSLLAKHNFMTASGEKAPGLFPDSSLIRSNLPPGTRLTGGFARFHDVTQVLNRHKVDPYVEDAVPAESPAASESTGPTPVVASPPATDTVFRTSARLVEVYATVTDGRGRYVDDLKPEQFSIVEADHGQPITAFENHTASVSVAMLFDTTGSMEGALPSLKAAALHLLDELRADDSVAVYGFNDHVAELQPFTTDKTAAKRAVLRAHAAGSTALYDALLRVNHDLAARPGKKVIIVFTDGDDNSSMLTADDVIERAKARGIPIYTIAEGEALDSLKLLDQLANMSRATGARPFVIHRLSDISAVFQKVSDDLMHGYLLAFQPRASEEHVWHPIKVVLSTKGHQVRAREGYFPD